jgi:hypothetical protein
MSGKNKYVVTVVPDDGTPCTMEMDDEAALLAALSKALPEAKRGYCYIHSEGARCNISAPAQLFRIAMPDKVLDVVVPGDKPVFSSDGRFSTLAPRPDRPD